MSMSNHVDCLSHPPILLRFALEENCLDSLGPRDYHLFRHSRHESISPSSDSDFVSSLTMLDGNRYESSSRLFSHHPKHLPTCISRRQSTSNPALTPQNSQCSKVSPLFISRQHFQFENGIQE